VMMTFTGKAHSHVASWHNTDAGLVTSTLANSGLQTLTSQS
jgi:hypothetical protein